MYVRSPGGVARPLARGAMWVAAATIVIAAGDVRSAAASSSAVVPPVAGVSPATTPLAPFEGADTCAAPITQVPPLAMLGKNTGGSIATMGDPGDLRVTCALPYVNGKPGADCTGKHRIEWSTSNAGPNAKVTAELMGLDTSGMLLDSFVVSKGDTVHLASRLSPGDWKFTRTKNLTSVFAPVPLLKVTVEDQGRKAEAFCSNVPWLDVIQPNGGVVTESSGNETQVLAAVPLTDPNALHLYVDGDDLLDDVGSYLGCTYLAPCSGTADINGQSVAYKDLAVDIASGIGSQASNTVRVTLQDLSCGGHFVRVSSSQLPGALKNPTSAACHVDDLTDKGAVSIFAITITNPVPGQVTSVVPTPVEGEVCSGTEIVEANVNGKSLPVAGQTFQQGDGETAGDVYKLVINTTLDRTDLVRDVLETQDVPLGTFDAGSNRLVASAREVQGHRTYERLIFATGEVAPIGVDVNATVFQSSRLEAAVNQQLKSRVEASVQQTLAGTTTELQNAFVVGISAEGTQTLFNKLCTTPVSFEGQMLTPGQIFQKKVSEAINAIDDGGIVITPDVPCSPDPDVTLTITNVTVGDQVTCSVDFHDGYFEVTMGLPDIHVDVHAYGTGGGWGADICGAGVKIEGDAYSDVTNIHLKFQVTEDNLLHNTFSAANFDTGVTLSSNGSVGAEFCGFGVVCNVLVTIFTFGAVDINPEIDFSLVQDFSSEIGANQPDPVKLNEIKVDEQVVASFDQKLSGAVSSVRITPDGISAGLKGEFATMVIDADVEPTPGITLTPVTQVPTFGNLRSQGAQDALIGLSDDSINMMFASLTAAGKLKPSDDPQGCVDTGATVGTLLPADCDTLNVGDALASAGARGYCHAIRGANCGTLAFGNDAFLTSTEQGVCYGASGAICTDIANFDLVRYGACSISPNLNLHATQPLLFCAKGDVPPRMLFPATGMPGGLVPSALRVNDLTVALVIDRTENHAVDGALAAAPSCFATGASTAADCNVFAACLDLNLNFGMQFLTCSDGKPGFKSTFDSIQILHRDVGVVCSGATSPTSDGDVLTTASDDTITIPIGQNAGQLSPDICGAGLDLGGLVTCATPKVLSLEADGSPNLRDYLGITCTIQ